MSIYTVDASIKNSRISSFVEHGLEGCAPSTVFNAGISAIPSRRPTAVSNIMANLHGYVFATIAQKATVDNLDCLNVVKYFEEIPVAQPNTMINVKGLGESSREHFKELGFSEESNLNFPGEFMISGNVSFESVKKLWTSGPDPFGTSPAGNCNPAGLYTFYLCWKAIGAFQTAVGGRFEGVPSVLSRMASDTEKIERIGGTAPAISLHESQLEVIQSPTDRTKVEENTTYLVDALPLVTAIRSTCNRSKFWHDLKYNPTDSGFVFPYFADMLIPESDYMAGVFFRNFSTLVGDSIEAVSKVLPILRRGFKSLKATRQGRELQHLMFGVQMTIDLGCCMRIIVDKRVYRGFVLLGEDLRILVRNQVKTSVPRAELKDLVLSLDSHSRAILRLTEIVSQVTLKVGGKLAKWDQERASSSSRYLANQLHSRALKGTEFEEEVKALVKQLRYGDEYWTIDEENTIRIFDCLLTGSIDDSAPFFLGGEMWDTDSSYARILSVFGERAPSISNRTGSKVFSLARPGEDDPLLAGGNDRKLPYLPIYKSGLLEAASMWETIQRTHSIRYIPSKAKGPGKIFDRKADVGHISGDRFLVFYEKLRSFAYAAGGSKRAREEEVDNVIKAGEKMARRKTELDEMASFM